MRLLAGLMAFAMVFGTATLTVEAREKRYDRKRWSKHADGYHSYRRPSTVAPNGTCWRDNGRPFARLNLNQRCDREEFWARMNERGNDRN